MNRLKDENSCSELRLTDVGTGIMSYGINDPSNGMGN